MKKLLYLFVATVYLSLSFSACSPCLRTVPETLTSEPSMIKQDINKELSLKEYLAQATWDEHATIPFPESESILLENGLRIFVVERHDLPMVYAQAQIRGGSIYDPPGKEGLSYLTGWILTEGTESYPDQEIDDVMDRHGAYVTSVAYNESCIATLTCLSKDITRLFPYFSEILSRPAFESANLEEARQYLIGDIMRLDDNPGDLAYYQFRKDVFKDHPYSKPHKGSINGLKSITREDVMTFYQTYYAPNRTVLVLVGDVTVEQIRTLCEQTLAQWKPSTETLPEIPNPTPIQGVQIHILDKDTSQSQIMIGNIGINRVNPDRFRIEVMNDILGGDGLFARLATEVRVKRGLTYGIYSFFAEREFTGEFVVSTFTKVDSTAETIRIILDELKKIRDVPVSDAELREAKQGLIGSFPLKFEEYEGIAQTIVHSHFYHLPMTDITEYPRWINEVTAGDVRTAAQTYIQPDNLLIVILGPADRLRPQLEALNLGTIDVIPGIEL